MAHESVDFLKIENVTKKFEGKTVLDNISATLSTGKILGLTGKSAAGKSVLIHMIRGTDEYRPDEGRILYHVNRCTKCGNLDLPFDGVPCTACGGKSESTWIDYWALSERDPTRHALKSRISIMLQRTFALFGDHTVVENVFEALGDRPDKVQKAIELLDFVNMTHRTTHIARDLSGGEKQRVVMARQLARDPLFFLADEPTGTLDPYTAEIVHQRLVKYVRDKGICMIMASHGLRPVGRQIGRAHV